MKNVVAKTALKTFIIVLCALVAAFVVASLGFPGHMATLFENLGNYSFATGYASLAYTYSGTEDDLARCVEDSILAEDDADVLNFAGEMVGGEGFEEYCKNRDEEMKNKLSDSGMEGLTDFSYKQYVMGNLACSQYAMGKKDDALKTAESAMNGVSFPSYNALVMLARRACDSEDAEMKSKLFDMIGAREVLPEEADYRDAVLRILG